ncbi:MAG: hypothetical protein ACXW3S_10335 [Rhodoplanes sp.]
MKDITAFVQRVFRTDVHEVAGALASGRPGLPVDPRPSAGISFVAEPAFLSPAH